MTTRPRASTLRALYHTLPSHHLNITVMIALKLLLSPPSPRLESSSRTDCCCMRMEQRVSSSGGGCTPAPLSLIIRRLHINIAKTPRLPHVIESGPNDAPTPLPCCTLLPTSLSQRSGSFVAARVLGSNTIKLHAPLIVSSAVRRWSWSAGVAGRRRVTHMKRLSAGWSLRRAHGQGDARRLCAWRRPDGRVRSSSATRDRDRGETVTTALIAK